MDNKIDLDAIILELQPVFYEEYSDSVGTAYTSDEVKKAMREAIKQALVLASESATVDMEFPQGGGVWADVNKESILSILNLVA